MKYRLVACAMLALSSLPTHAQGVTTQGMASDIQAFLKKPDQRVDAMTAARFSSAISLVIGEYVVLTAVAEKEQGHLGCIDEKMDRDKILKNVSQAIKADNDISANTYLGTMEAITEAYPCLTPRAFVEPATNGKVIGNSN